MRLSPPGCSAGRRGTPSKRLPLRPPRPFRRNKSADPPPKAPKPLRWSRPRNSRVRHLVGELQRPLLPFVLRLSQTCWRVARSFFKNARARRSARCADTMASPRIRPLIAGPILTSTPIRSGNRERTRPEGLGEDLPPESTSTFSLGGPFLQRRVAESVLPGRHSGLVASSHPLPRRDPGSHHEHPPTHGLRRPCQRIRPRALIGALEGTGCGGHALLPRRALPPVRRGSGHIA